MKENLVFEDFKPELEELNDQIRVKALEIANERYQKENLSKKEAIRIGIKLAEEWWMNLEA